MPRKAFERAGGTWTDIDLATNHAALIANTAADAAQASVVDTALQPADVGTAAAADTGDFAPAAAGVLVDTMKLALSGDMVLVCTPDTVGSSAAVVMADIGGVAAKFVRNVVVTLETGAGAIHTWYSGARDTATVGTTAGNGTVALENAAASITFTNGSATAVMEYINSWAADDEASFTVTGGTLLGYTIADATSIDTLIA